MRKGVVATPVKALTLGEVRDRFLKGVRNGVVLNKHGRKFRKRAAGNLESSLNHLPDVLLAKPARDVRPGEIQSLADELAERDPPLSGSRIRSVIYGTSSLFQFAEGREFASHNPADGVRLPASEEKPRDFVVTPAVFAAMLKALEEPTPSERGEGITRSKRDALRDQVPYALAAYGTARNSEIKYLDWSDVYFEARALELAADEEGRKPGGSWRIVPMVGPLVCILRAEWRRKAD